MESRVVRARAGAAALVLGLAGGAVPAGAQWVQTHEQFYLPASHNWVFRQNYASADRLFNAFDFGHAILYETLYAKPGAPVSELEVRWYDYLTTRLLRRPPRVPLEEGAIEVGYAKFAPEAKLMFEWAHILHRQLYDVLADERLTGAQKDAAVAELLDYYRTRPDLAFSSRPKSMELMDGQYYSLAFRRGYPKFNGLIWAYHWLQIGLYEPLLVNRDVATRTMGVNATVGRFWQMLENPPETMPYLMPMTAGVAPVFAARYPEAGVIFDNLHMMHDVISDILASPEVPRERKRAEILRAAALFRDDTSYVISMDEWRMMGQMMGVNNMGGVAVGFLAELPLPTVERGMSMAGMDHGAMPGMQHGQPGQQGMQHGQQGVQHGQMQHGPPGGQMQGMQHGAAPAGAGGATMARMMAMHERMMSDPVIRERVATDPVLQRMMAEMGMTPDAHALPGMQMPMGGAGVSEEDRRRAMEFIVRLLSDPAVEARVHADPELHRLWSDPEVQRRLAELRRTTPAPAAPPPEHRHP